MLLIFLDSETGGLDCHIHRILEISFQILNTCSDRIICTYSSLIKHEQTIWQQRNQDSLFINGLTEEYVNERGKTESQVATEIKDVFDCYGISKENAAFICQNPALDRMFFSQLISTETQHQNGWPYHWLDLASMFWIFKKISCRDQCSLNMLAKDNIAKFLGLEEEMKPHRALRGVEHLVACYRALEDRFQSSDLLDCNGEQ
ncbi:MAG: hypothetical protein RRZ67_00515 [Victivallaceae bacterium]